MSVPLPASEQLLRRRRAFILAVHQCRLEPDFRSNNNSPCRRLTWRSRAPRRKSALPPTRRHADATRKHARPIPQGDPHRTANHAVGGREPRPDVRALAALESSWNAQMPIEVMSPAGGANWGPGRIAYRSVQVFPVEVAADRALSARRSATVTARSLSLNPRLAGVALNLLMASAYTLYCVGVRRR